MDKVEWTCGHVAGSVCAECNAALIRRANIFVEIIDALLDRMDVNDQVAVEQRQRLQTTLNPGWKDTTLKGDSDKDEGNDRS